MKKKLLVNNLGEIIEDLLLITPSIYYDTRGYFYESWNQKEFTKLIGKSINFLQDNHSFSMQGVIRGLHYQVPPFQQQKLVTCIRGEIFDVAVDIRKKSPTFGSWSGTYLNEKNHNQLWVPEGFAHGFIVTSSFALVMYKVDQYWKKNHEHSIRWDDEDLKISWPLKVQEDLISEKDSNATSFIDLNDDKLF